MFLENCNKNFWKILRFQKPEARIIQLLETYKIYIEFIECKIQVDLPKPANFPITS